METVKVLARRGAKVYYTTRSEAKSKQTIDRIKSTDPDLDLSRVIGLVLDLGDLKTVVAAVEELKRREDKVDILSMA